VSDKLAGEIADHVFPLAIDYVDLEGIGASDTLDAHRGRLVHFRRDGIPVGHVFEPYHAGDTDRRLSAVAAGVVAADIEAHLAKVRSTTVVETDVSILICTRDRAKDLAKCLASLDDQTLKAREIIVVDNASKTAETREVAEAAGVRYVREDRPGLDIARNTAIRSASGKIVAFTDDDVALHPAWLENLVKAFDSPDIGCVTGLVLPGEIDTPAQFIFETRWGFGRGYRRKDFDADFYSQHRGHGCPVWDIGAGASQAFRRDVFDVIGLFDERLDVGAAGCCGDSEIWNRLLHHGYVCRYEPTAVAWHFHRRDMPGLKKQIRAYMSGHTAAQLVQWQRTGESGNIRYFFRLAGYYADRFARRLVRGRPKGNDMFVFTEIAGCFAGIAYILKHRHIPEDRS
jgi:glycosyltransferase involved in cell wall biosynthesis